MSNERERWIELCRNLVNQFAYKKGDGDEHDRLYTGGLSDLEDAFAMFGLGDGCTRQQLWDAHPVTTRQEDGVGAEHEPRDTSQQASDAPAPPSVVEALRDLLDTLGDPEEYGGHIIVEIYKARAALDALPEAVVDEVCRVTDTREHSLGCGVSAEAEKGNIKLDAYALTKFTEGDRLRVVVWREGV